MEQGMTTYLLKQKRDMRIKYLTYAVLCCYQNSDVMLLLIISFRNLEKLFKFFSDIGLIKRIFSHCL